MRYANITSIPSSYIVAFFSSLGDASPPGEGAPQLGSSSLLNQQSTCLIKYDVIRFTLLRIETERLRAIAQTTCST